jgi:hypothetical protein
VKLENPQPGSENRLYFVHTSRPIDSSRNFISRRPFQRGRGKVGHRDRDGSLGTQRLCNRDAASLFAEEIVNLVGDRRTDRIFLVGREHIEFLVQLLHHGFTDVTCRSALAGPNAGELTADIFVIPTAEREPQFTPLVARLGSALRPGGVLLIGAAVSPFATRIRTIQQVLHRNGFGFVRRRFDPLHLNLLCCRKLALAQSRAA